MQRLSDRSADSLSAVFKAIRRGGQAVRAPFLVLVLLAILTISCEGRRSFQVKGVIKEISADRKQAKIEHEKIPGYMEAMTMMFDVKDPKELQGLQPNDQVSFRMIVTQNDGWIDQVKKIGTVAAATNDPSIFRRVREVEPTRKNREPERFQRPGVGDHLPLHPLPVPDVLSAYGWQLQGNIQVVEGEI